MEFQKQVVHTRSGAIDVIVVSGSEDAEELASLLSRLDPSRADHHILYQFNQQRCVLFIHRAASEITVLYRDFCGRAMSDAMTQAIKSALNNVVIVDSSRHQRPHQKIYQPDHPDALRQILEELEPYAASQGGIFARHVMATALSNDACTRSQPLMLRRRSDVS